jgi:hypothetical protein
MDSIIIAVIVVLVIGLIYLYQQNTDLKSLIEQSNVVREKLNNELVSQNKSNTEVIKGLQEKLDDLTKKLSEAKPKLDELMQYKATLSLNLYYSLQANDVIFNESSNKELLIKISAAASELSVSGGKTLCALSKILARYLKEMYRNGRLKAERLCDPELNSKIARELGNVATSNVYLIIMNLTKLTQVYFCNNQTEANFDRTLNAFVNVICNPSAESQQLYKAYMKTLLRDLDNNYKNNANPNVLSDVQVIPGGSVKNPDGSVLVDNTEYNVPLNTGDPTLNKLFTNDKNRISIRLNSGERIEGQM